MDEVQASSSAESYATYLVICTFGNTKKDCRKNWYPLKLKITQIGLAKCKKMIANICAFAVVYLAQQLWLTIKPEEYSSHAETWPSDGICRIILRLISGVHGM